MEALRNISRILFVFPVITLIYDLVYFWFVKSTFKIRSLKGWGEWLMPDTYKGLTHFLTSHGAAHGWDKLSALPAPVALGILPLALYLIYRLIFLLQGGKSGGYKSRY